MDSKHLVFEHVWLADDDKDDCDLFTDVIGQILPLAKVTLITNGEMLMQKLKGKERPDCLFLDINMPLMDGLECLLQIRAQRCFRSLPVIIFSSTTQQEHLETSYKYGANLFYTKPSTFQELIAGLSSIFKMNWKDPNENFVYGSDMKFAPILSQEKRSEKEN
jgi:CheY-like chemotaxis protein